MLGEPFVNININFFFFLKKRGVSYGRVKKGSNRRSTAEADVKSGRPRITRLKE